MDLPKNERTFFFNAVGEYTQQKFEGEFTVLCVPTMLQRRSIEIERGRITGDMSNPTSNLFSLAIMLGNLRIRILKSPGWWTDSNGGSTLRDDNVVLALFEQVMQQEEDWRDEVRKKAAGGDDLGNPPKESR